MRIRNGKLHTAWKNYSAISNRISAKKAQIKLLKEQRDQYKEGYYKYMIKRYK